MPRVAEPDPSDKQFPWLDWEKELKASPTGALLFDQDDFGLMSPRLFRERARKAFKHLGARVSVQGEEVRVAVDAS